MKDTTISTEDARQMELWFQSGASAWLAEHVPELGDGADVAGRVLSSYIRVLCLPFTSDFKPWRLRSEVETFGKAIAELTDVLTDENRAAVVGQKLRTFVVDLLKDSSVVDTVLERIEGFLKTNNEDEDAELSKSHRVDGFLRFIYAVEQTTGDHDRIREILSTFTGSLKDQRLRRMQGMFSLSMVEDEPEDVIAEEYLKFFGEWCQTYECVVDAILDLARLGTTHGRPGPYGRKVQEASKLLAARFVGHESLIDEAVVHLRNAIKGHDLYSVDAASREIELWDRDGKGNETHRETISFRDIPYRAHDLIERINAAEAAARMWQSERGRNVWDTSREMIRQLLLFARAVLLKCDEANSWEPLEKFMSIFAGAHGDLPAAK